MTDENTALFEVSRLAAQVAPNGDVELTATHRADGSAVTVRTVVAGADVETLRAVCDESKRRRDAAGRRTGPAPGASEL